MMIVGGPIKSQVYDLLLKAVDHNSGVDWLTSSLNAPIDFGSLFLDLMVSISRFGRNEFA